MSDSLDRFRQELREAVLTFVWQQWSCIGVMASGGAERARVIDPEPLLLLTLEVARQDPRMFDEVVDWLIVNGKWINVGRLSALFDEDQICSRQVLGAVAAILTQHDKTPKWRNLANKFKPEVGKEAESLFEKNGKPLFLRGSEPDKVFQSYGLLRLPLQTRGLSSPVLPSPVPFWTPSNFMFKARALFGVNIRADVFTFLVLQGASNPTRIARELGYSQRRVHDALSDMAAADIFKIRTTGKSKEYSVDSENTLRFLGVSENDISWFDWRALARALITVWRRAFAMQAEGMTPYILESELQKTLSEVKNDLLSAVPKRQSTMRSEAVTTERNISLLQSLHRTLTSSSGYNWKRLWVPREGTISFADDGYPFVPKPDKVWPSLIQSDVVPFESIAGLPCLVLLGEPGMGKSFALRAAAKAVEKSMEETATKTLFLDLRSYGNEDRLIRDLFESERFRDWSRGECQLHVFLDSLDEALLRQSTIAHVLLDKLNDCPSVAGLFLRIACRTAEWPTMIENGLKSKWGEKTVSVYELVPLSKANVVEAADANSIDSDDFLCEVDNREVIPLAFKPVTLNFLIKTFQKNGRLASTQKDLYLEGCRILCEEPNESRIGVRLTGKLTAGQRLEVAGHIAAATVLCNRNAVWTGPNRGPVTDSDLSLDELCVSASNETMIPMTREAVMETLSTGLFSSRGPERLGWAHQTYAEFLAAWWLISRKLPPCQMLNLFVHHGDAEGRLVPQLHETAAWLASMDSEIFRKLAKSDPEVLLRSDVATASADDKEKVVESLLNHLEEDNLIEWEWSLHRRYRKLLHPRLAQQLRSFIVDRSKNIIVRREAINISEACKIETMAAELALVALDSSEELSVRAKAASFVSTLGQPHLKTQLKPLVKLPGNLDPNDELKGWALKACWPACMAAEELFSLITPPKNESFVGAYFSFLTGDLVESLTLGDLLVALRWVREQKPKRELPYAYVELLDDILEKAVENLEQSSVLEEFAVTILNRLRKHDEFYGRPSDWTKGLETNESARHRIIEAILPELSQLQNDTVFLVYWKFPLITASDVPWLIDRLEREPNAQYQVALVHLLRKTANLSEASHVDGIIRLSEINASIRQFFSYFLTPIELQSREAHQAREDYLKRKEAEVRLGNAIERALLKPPPAERIARLLDKCEQGELDAWWQLVMDMTLEPTSTRYEHEEKTDLTQLPGWVAADASTRARIISAARKYVFERESNPEAWLKENIWYRPAVAGFKALCLLHKETPLSSDRIIEGVSADFFHAM